MKSNDMNKSKTIMICVPDFLRKYGGPTESILKQINLLNKKNYSIYLLTLTIDPDIYKNIKAKKFILKNGNFFERAKKLFEALILINKVDYLHIHSFWTKFIFLILLFCKPFSPIQ